MKIYDIYYRPMNCYHSVAMIVDKEVRRCRSDTMERFYM